MRALLTATLAATVLGAGLAQAYAASCQELWVERNQYYKDAGYCFETERAIAYFGNRGCWIQGQSNVRLSSTAQRAVEQIVSQERRQGCND
jgi:YARHG domain